MLNILLESYKYTSVVYLQSRALWTSNPICECLYFMRLFHEWTSQCCEPSSSKPMVNVSGSPCQVNELILECLIWQHSNTGEAYMGPAQSSCMQAGPGFAGVPCKCFNVQSRVIVAKVIVAKAFILPRFDNGSGIYMHPTSSCLHKLESFSEWRRRFIRNCSCPTFLLYNVLHNELVQLFLLAEFS